MGKTGCLVLGQEQGREAIWPGGQVLPEVEGGADQAF